MNTRYNSFFQFVFTFIDLWGINMSFVAALFLMSDANSIFQSGYLALFLVSNLFWMLACAATSIYINSNSYKLGVLTGHTIQSYIIYLLLIAGYIYFAPFTYELKFVAALLGGFA